MSFKMQRVHVYHTEVEDKPGGVGGLLKVLAAAGAHLEYVYSQRSATKQGVGDLYVAPLRHAAEITAAKASGMREVAEPTVMRLEGDDKAGLSGKLTQAWEMAGINLHGLVLSVLGGRFVGYVTFDSPEDGNRAAIILAELGTSAAHA
ncbi:MAG: amino acid-binding ACT [Planctomycetota bacterium]|nr:amino acid-binding ACT [Planctomycetota bacterium]